VFWWLGAALFLVQHKVLFDHVRLKAEYDCFSTASEVILDSFKEI